MNDDIERNSGNNNKRKFREHWNFLNDHNIFVSNSAYYSFSDIVLLHIENRSC